MLSRGRGPADPVTLSRLQVAMETRVRSKGSVVESDTGTGSESQTASKDARAGHMLAAHFFAAPPVP